MTTLIVAVCVFLTTILLTKGEINIRIIHKNEYEKNETVDLTDEDKNADELYANMGELVHNIDKMMGGESNG